MSKETVVGGIDVSKITEALGGPDITTIVGTVTPVLRAVGVSPAWDGIVTIGAAIVAVLMALGYLNKPKAVSTAATATTVTTAATAAPTVVQVALPPGMMLVPATPAAPVSSTAPAAPAAPSSAAVVVPVEQPAPAAPVTLIGSGYTKV